jgi:type IV pilus assembly protein PilV
MLSKRHPMKSPIILPTNRQHGATLLEVLISIIVVALGLLGFAGLQVASLKSNNTAYYRSQATMLAYDVIDRIRVDRVNAMAGSYNLNWGASGDGEVLTWRQNVADSLPAGNAKIVVNGGTNSVQVFLQWDDDGDGVPTEFRTTTNL